MWFAKLNFMEYFRKMKSKKVKFSNFTYICKIIKKEEEE